MTESELLRIETELQLRLPAWYRDCSLAYPFRMAGAEWMFDDPEDVIGSTRHPLEEGEFDTASFKSSYVVIGESASGDLYLIDVESSESAVLVLSHEDHSITPEWPTFEVFIDDWQAYEQTSENRLSEQAEFDRWFWQRWRRVMLVIVVFAVIVPLLVIWLAHTMQQ